MTDAEVILRWALDPEACVREAIRAEPTPQQIEGLEALKVLVRAKYRVMRGEASDADRDIARRRGVSIQSGVGTGKDAFCAWVILWFLMCWPYSKIPCVAPTQHQLRDILWSEVAKWVRHSRTQHEAAQTGFRLDKWITWQSDKVFFTELGGRQWFAIARTANPKAAAEEQAETLAGLHEDNLCVIIDEASGVPEPVFRPLEATLTGPMNFAVVVFNPTRAQGFAIDTQQSQRDHWLAMRWNSEESPIVAKESIDYIADKYGRDSNAYRIRVLGLPPHVEEDVLIPWELVMEAVDRDVVPLEDDPWVLGIDVARFGSDLSVILARRGPVVDRLKIFNGLDTEQLSGWIMNEIFEREPAYVFVDTIGIGAGVADKLRHRCRHVQIIDVMTSERPATDPRRFRRLRDELWWRTRERFFARTISIPQDDELIAELSTPRYEINDGKIVVMSKKKMKLTVHGSPNRADALVMTEYMDPQWLRVSAGRPRRSNTPTWRTA